MFRSLGIILLKEMDTPIGTKHSLIPSYLTHTWQVKQITKWLHTVLGFKFLRKKLTLQSGNKECEVQTIHDKKQGYHFPKSLVYKRPKMQSTCRLTKFPKTMQEHFLITFYNWWNTRKDIWDYLCLQHLREWTVLPNCLKKA